MKATLRNVYSKQYFIFLIMLDNVRCLLIAQCSLMILNYLVVLRNHIDTKTKFGSFLVTHEYTYYRFLIYSIATFMNMICS